MRKRKRSPASPPEGSRTTAQAPPAPHAPAPAADLRQLVEHALAAYRRQQWAEAERHCRAVLDADPRHFDALHLAGIVAALDRRLDEAVDLLSRAVSANPGSADARNSLGNVLRELGRHAEALACFDQAIALRPGYANAFNNRGATLHVLKRPAEALESLDRALALNPDYPGALHNRGNALDDLGRHAEAVESYQRALTLLPEFPQAHNALGTALRALGRSAEALECQDRALTLDPGFVDAYRDRGDALSDLGRHAEAIASYDRALALAPDCQFLPGVRLHAATKICDWSDLEDRRARLLDAVERGERASPPFPVLALSGSRAAQKTAAEVWVRGVNPPNPALPVIAARMPHDRIRVGYFSSDFREHAVSYLLAEVLARHDKSKFELTAFSFAASAPDAMRATVAAAFERFLDVRGASDRDVALLARQLEIDIAVDLNGFTRGARPDIFALRAAPVQVNYLGYPGTMGAEYIDYLVADPTLVPESHRGDYAEKIAYLPGCYMPRDTRRPVADTAFARDALGLPPTGVTLCCFNRNYKVLPSVFDRWMRVLARVDGAVLWLSGDAPEAVAALRREAQRRGVDPGRLIFAPATRHHAEHLARHRAADLFLDTLPYNAHATANDALWMGVPVVTCIGEAFAGRVGASHLNALGLPELVMTTLDRYEELAVQLATNPDRLREAKERVARQRPVAPLFDIAAYTRHLESAFTTMHERQRAGLAPDHIFVRA